MRDFFKRTSPKEEDAALPAAFSDPSVLRYDNRRKYEKHPFFVIPADRPDVLLVKWQNAVPPQQSFSVPMLTKKDTIDYVVETDGTAYGTRSKRPATTLPVGSHVEYRAAYGTFRFRNVHVNPSPPPPLPPEPLPAAPRLMLVPAPTPSYAADLRAILETIPIERDTAYEEEATKGVAQFVSDVRARSKTRGNGRMRKWVLDWMTKGAVKSLERVCARDLLDDDRLLTDDVIVFLADNALVDVDLVIAGMEARAANGTAGLSIALSALPYGGASVALVKVLTAYMKKTFVDFWSANRPYLQLKIKQLLRKRFQSAGFVYAPRQTREFFTLNNVRCKQYDLTETMHEYVVFGNCAFRRASDLATRVTQVARVGDEYLELKLTNGDTVYVPLSEPDDGVDTVVYKNEKTAYVNSKEERDLHAGLRIEYHHEGTIYRFANVRYVADKGEEHG